VNFESPKVPSLPQETSVLIGQNSQQKNWCKSKTGVKHAKSYFAGRLIVAGTLRVPTATKVTALGVCLLLSRGDTANLSGKKARTASFFAQLFDTAVALL
jgi:hypothetical protein